jgi:hypothetical protein
MTSGFSIRRALAAATALLSAGYTGLAPAHTQVGSLGQNINATDTYQITCSDDGNGAPARLVAAIKDRPPVKPPLVSVTIQWDSQNAVSTDPVDGDNAAGPEVALAGGAGPYTATIKKLNKPGRPDASRQYPEIYELTYHCLTAANVHTGTNLVQVPPNQ